MNRYALYALKSDGNDYAQTDAIENCSFNGGTTFTFGMDVYCTMQNGEVFSQNNSVACFLQSGSIVWKGIGWELIAEKSYSGIMMDEWNHIDVVYGEGKASLYLNGLLADETKMGTEPVYSTEKYHYLGGYCGYIKNVRIVDHAMTEDEIRNNLIITSLPEEQLWLYLPFDSAKPEDKGKYKKSVQCTGFCYCKDFVKALYFSGDGYALLDGITDNPGSDQCSAFTVVLRIFPDGSVTDTSVLFENTGAADLLQLCLSNREAKLTVNIGSHQVTTNEIPSIKDSLWSDIAVSVNGTELKIYVNGALVKSDTIEAYVRTSAPRMVLGSKFVGAIDYFAIYKDALSDEYIADIHKVEPYIFDSGISALFLFHGEQKTNMLGSGSVMLHNSEFHLLEGTLYDAQPELFDFRKGEEFSGTKLEKWEAGLIAALGVGFAATAVGIARKPGVMAGGIEALIDDTVLNSSEAQYILGDYSKITAKQVQNLVTSKAVQSIIGPVTSVATQGVVTGAVAVAASNSVKVLVASGVIAATTFVSAIAAIVAVSTKTSDPPDDEKEEKEPKKGYHIYLESVQMCNGTAGSIPLRTDLDTPLAVPEWSRDGEKNLVAAYIAKEQTPEITVRFRYKPAKDQKPVKVKFHLGNFDLLGDGESEPIDCAVADTVYEAVIKCRNNKLSDAGMGKHCARASFRFELVGGDQNARTNSKITYADMTVYTLCKEPVKPWSVKDKTKAPLIALLELAAKISVKMDQSRKKKVVQETDFLEAVGEWSKNNQNYVLEADSQYSVRKSVYAEFYMKKFYNAMNSNTISMGILDYYLVILELAAMEGFSFELYEIGSIENWLICSDGVSKIETAGVKLEKSIVFGKEWNTRFFRLYLIKGKEDSLCWDLLFRTSKEGKDQYNLSWEDYKKEMISTECYVEEPLIISEWKESNEIADLKIGYDVKRETFVTSKRNSFKSFIKRMYYFSDQKACCHRISYNVLDNTLASLMNLLKNGVLQLGKFQELIRLIAVTFYPEAPSPGSLGIESQYNFNNYQALVKNYNKIISYKIEDFRRMINDETERNAFLMCMTTFLDALNNTPDNLRVGYSTWNSSIGDKFDPSVWVYQCYLNGAYCQFSNLQQDWKQITGFSAGKTGYYIGSEQQPLDGRFYHLLHELSSALQDASILSVKLGSYNNKPIIYSSNNCWEFKVSEHNVTEDNVFYWYNGKWELAYSASQKTFQ